MTKKHYEAIASVIKNQSIIDPRYNVENFYSLAISLCEYFERDNKNFDRKRFLQACGYTDYTYTND